MLNSTCTKLRLFFVDNHYISLVSIGPVAFFCKASYILWGPLSAYQNNVLAAGL